MFDALSPRLECHVVAPTNYTGRIPGRNVFRVPCGISKIGGMLGSVNPVAHWKTAAAVFRAKPDVVHLLSGEGYLWAVSLALTARLTGIPVIVTLHDPDPHPGNIFERLNAIVRRPVMALAGTVHVFSSQHLQRAGEVAPATRLVVIEHGSLAGQFLRHRKEGIRRESLVLFFGRIQHYKGIDVLLRAMTGLDETIRLAIAGPGEMDPDDLQMISALGERVELHNKYLDDAEVAALMQRARVVALPYRHATQSSVPAIAAAFGCKLVASALGHFQEEIPRLGGDLVPAEDSDALAVAITKAFATTVAIPVISPTFDDLAPSFVQLYRSSVRQNSPLHRPAEQGLSQ
jgi:glycosyltransferase involved in cell wall biosynthesis